MYTVAETSPGSVGVYKDESSIVLHAGSGPAWARRGPSELDWPPGQDSD